MPMSKRSLPRWAALGLPLVVLGATSALVLGAASCVNPQQDFNDYLARAADAQGPPSSTGVVEASAVDAALLHPPDAAVNDTRYVMACETTFGQSAAEAFLFVATMTFTPSAGGGGTATLQAQSLPVGAKTVDGPVGDVFHFSSGKVAADGTARLLLPGTTTIPAAANPVGGQDVVASNLGVDLRLFADGTACAGLEGQITAPVSTLLTPSNNPCVFRAAPGGAVPAFTNADFHCP